jgi:hypothetical protein
MNLRLHSVWRFLDLYRWSAATALAVLAGCAQAMNSFLLLVMLVCLSMALSYSSHRLSAQIGYAAGFGSLAAITNLGLSSLLNDANYFGILYRASRLSVYDSYFLHVSLIYLFPVVATILMTAGFRFVWSRHEQRESTQPDT